MNIAEYLEYDALGLAELVRKKDVSPKELALLAAQCVEKVNPTLNAVIEVYADRVDGLDESAIPEGPFYGVPFFLKDLGPRQKAGLKTAALDSPGATSPTIRPSSPPRWNGPG